MQQEYYYEMLKYKPILFKKLMDKFLFLHKNHPQSQIDFEGKNFDFLKKNTEIVNYLKADSFEFSWDYTTDEQIFTLLSKEELINLAYLFGTCMHAKEISLILKKEELFALKNLIGDDLYKYALEKGQYKAQNLAHNFALFDQDLNIIERIKLHGQEALYILSANWPEEEKQKLPKLSELESEALSKLNDMQKRSLISSLKKILIKDITSEWQQCLD